jgi:hypothetical protein
MDITVEGFMDWMFKVCHYKQSIKICSEFQGLTFLLPFLLLCYVFQGYTAYLLFDMYFQQGCQEWQVIVLAVAFTLVAIGNILTTAILVVRKCLEVSRANSLLKVQVFSKYREKTC